MSPTTTFGFFRAIGFQTTKSDSFFRGVQRNLNRPGPNVSSARLRVVRRNKRVRIPKKVSVPRSSDEATSRWKAYCGATK